MRIDLKGNTLMPGFIDPHSHLVQLASSLRFVNLSDCHTHTEIRQKLTAYKIKERPAPGSWIIGFGYDHNILAEKQHPTKKVLDEVSTEHPVMVSHASGHMGVANSKALEALNIHSFHPCARGRPDW